MSLFRDILAAREALLVYESASRASPKTDQLACPKPNNTGQVLMAEMCLGLKYSGDRSNFVYSDNTDECPESASQLSSIDSDSRCITQSENALTWTERDDHDWVKKLGSRID